MFVNRKGKAGRGKGAPESAPPPARRIPTQERSRQRVERILDAAAVVFASQGFDAATMEGIAAAAETSIGSIYQFFPNKHAVFEALAARYHERERALFDSLVEDIEGSWSDILDAALDAFVALHENDPAFRAVWLGTQLTASVFSQAEALNRLFASRLEPLLARKLPRLPAARRGIVATMIVEIAGIMLVIRVRRGADEGRAILDETKTILRRYLAPYEEPEAPPRTARRSRSR